MTKITKQEIINVKCDGCRSLITNYDPQKNKTVSLEYFTLTSNFYHEDPTLKYIRNEKDDRDFCSDCEWNIQELIKTGIKTEYFKQVLESDTFKKILKKQKEDEKAKEKSNNKK